MQLWFAYKPRTIVTELYNDLLIQMINLGDTQQY